MILNHFAQILNQENMTNASITGLIILVLSFLGLFYMEPSKSNSLEQFYQFKLNYKKVYESQVQELYRRSIFMDNLNKIEEHNANKSLSYKLGITSFADLTLQQFKQTHLQKINIKHSSEIQIIREDFSSKKLDVEGDVDWVTNGYVSRVKNQGLCGSSWAFSTTGAIQSGYSIFKNINIQFSEQQLIDCSSNYGNNGCTGGRMDYGFSYVRDHGITTENQYPYTAKAQTCRKSQGEYKITNFINTAGCTSLFNALQQRPISAAVDASNWPLYRQGILSGCGQYINHGVLVVGVTQRYWKLKNSWGVNWGQDGYIRIARGNTCGVCAFPFFPLL